MKKNILLIFIILIFILIAVSILLINYLQSNRTIKKQGNIFYFLDDNRDSYRYEKIIITNKQELKKFYSLYPSFKHVNYNLSKYTIFVMSNGLSGSGSIHLDGVRINDKVEFDWHTEGDTRSPFEYDITSFKSYLYVAIIPKTELSDVDISDWISPLDINR